VRLRYVGATPITFITGSVGTVSHGDEFTVADELTSSFLARVDVEEVVEVVAEVKAPKRRRRTEEPGQSAAADGGDPEKMSEENGDVPNDH